MNKKVIIYGLGRMGLTHFAILNQLIKNAEFVFVDPDKKLNFFAKRNLKARIVNRDKKLNESFDYALVCTPPMFHASILENCINNNFYVQPKWYGGKLKFLNNSIYDNIMLPYTFDPMLFMIRVDSPFDLFSKDNFIFPKKNNSRVNY